MLAEPPREVTAFAPWRSLREAAITRAFVASENVNPSVSIERDVPVPCFAAQPRNSPHRASRRAALLQIVSCSSGIPLPELDHQATGAGSFAQRRIAPTAGARSAGLEAWRAPGWIPSAGAAVTRRSLRSPHMVSSRTGKRSAADPIGIGCRVRKSDHMSENRTEVARAGDAEIGGAPDCPDDRGRRDCGMSGLVGVIGVTSASRTGGTWQLSAIPVGDPSGSRDRAAPAGYIGWSVRRNGALDEISNRR
jgi:hypothetical protein